VPNLKVAVGSAPGDGFAVLGDDGEGAGTPVQDVTANARKTAPALTTVRRDVLLGTR
jgi:hypothetical protein